MAFDQTTRNRLARFVGDCRGLLTEEFTRQLQSIYGMDPDTAEVADLDSLTLTSTQYETARLLREMMGHYLAGQAKQDKSIRIDVLSRIVREQAFTVLNRLCAIRMAESRDLVIECISQGYQSKAFKLYQQLARTSLGETGDAYRVCLFSVFDEFAVDLPVLFDRFSPQGRLFPREAALLEVLEQLNHAEIEPLWSEDETIGWIYQYFNSDDDRRRARYTDDGTAKPPQDCRGLAIRNQFFTPRYVVEFLTDNTVGRVWHEMTQGATALTVSCRYLIRRPDEVFLAEGEAAPAHGESEELSQEELMRQPVQILHRPLKDPRDFTMLDPACGSMHFGLYAFDLFETIYEEAWDLETERGGDAFVRPEGLESLQETYDTKDAFLRDVPRLIIEHNIHGIDIDSRAVQIAGLSLWLRAQKSWHASDIPAQSRPKIHRSNIVCAEPMPGEVDMLEEFLAELRNTRLESLIRHVLNVPERQQIRATARMADALCDLVRTVWAEMELAGEAGSLLVIEESLADAIAKGKEEWEEKFPLFRVQEFGLGESEPKTSYLKRIPGEEENFWNRAEALVLAALESYAEHARRAETSRHQMFARDAAQGFAFIDIAAREYDVVLMNPPFGAFPVHADAYLNQSYPDCRGDLYPCCISRWAPKCAYLGAITNRTGLFLKGLHKWRQSSLLGPTQLAVLADMGIGVLDALVETAMYVTARSADDHLLAFDLLATPEHQHQDILAAACDAARQGTLLNNATYQPRSDYLALPSSPIAYKIPRGLLRAFSHREQIERDGLKFRVTSPNYDDFRYLRLRWEVPPSHIGRDKRWSLIVKGGEYQPYLSDINLLIDWDDKRLTFRGYTGTVHRPMERPACADLFFSGGLTWSERTASRFSPRVLPRGVVFSSVGPYSGGLSDDDMLVVLGVLSSAAFQSFLELFLAAGDATSSGSAARHYQVGALRALPDPELSPDSRQEIRQHVCGILKRLHERLAADEQVAWFDPASWGLMDAVSIADLDSLRAQAYVEDVFEILDASWAIEQAVRKAYSFSAQDLAYVSESSGPHPYEYPTSTTADAECLLVEDTDVVIRGAVESGITGRFITVKSYSADRHLEVLSHRLRVHPSSLRESFLRRRLNGSFAPTIARDIVSFAVGVAFGRWDPKQTQETFGPKTDGWFDELDVTPAAALQSADGSQESIKIPAHGVLGQYSGAPYRLTDVVRQVLGVIWAGSAPAIEQEACETISVRSLEEYFAGNSGFFSDHLARYSRSRRVAPVYWALATPSGAFTLWLFCHKLTDQTLYSCINDFVDPKLRQLNEDVARLRSEPSRSSSGERELERLTGQHLELTDFREELLRIANFWKPTLDDGIQVTAAPLWKLIQHRDWQAKLKETWEKLEAGEYDWAQLALSIWPDRVVHVSHKTRSYAIAHDLEGQLWEEIEVEKRTRGGRVKMVMEWRPRNLTTEELEAIIDDVKAR